MPSPRTSRRRNQRFSNLTIQAPSSDPSPMFLLYARPCRQRLGHISQSDGAPSRSLFGRESPRAVDAVRGLECCNPLGEAFGKRDIVPTIEQPQPPDWIDGETVAVIAT